MSGSLFHVASERLPLGRNTPLPMIDERIHDAAVLKAIYRDETHTVWSPCTTLSRMRIERYPHRPNHNRLAMKEVLARLHERGLLRRRARLHSHYSFREVAYERVPGLDWDDVSAVSLE